jgi:hypothetical protein
MHQSGDGNATHPVCQYVSNKLCIVTVAEELHLIFVTDVTCAIKIEPRSDLH